jgi:FtsP/CotA-like multicopper oxidase with cupredoxin domain
MRKLGRYFLTVWICGAGIGGAMAQRSACPARPFSGTVVQNPLDLTATNGVLTVDLTLHNRQMLEQALKVCYVYQSNSGPGEAPTLRLSPGDQLELALTDRMTYVPPYTVAPTPSPAPHGPCAGGIMAATSTNLEFHGLNVPSDCHQGESSVTTIENADPPFVYRLQIPNDHPPGMDWYHPFRQGSAALQVNGGASGVLIVGGMEKAKPEVAGLPERILVVRQQYEDEDDPDPWPPTEYRLTLNFQLAIAPHRPSPVIQMKPGGKEFWRVANAAAQAFLALQVVYGSTVQPVKLIALDGVPVRQSVDLRTIKLPPGGRAEFIVTGPAVGQPARLRQTEVELGRTGPENPAQELAKIVATPDAQVPPAIASAQSDWRADTRLSEARPTPGRKLYFAEATNGTSGPIRFFLTVEGQTPKAFNSSNPPDVVTKVGAVEDWVIANRTGNLHTFHMHGTHFLLLEANGTRVPNPELRDTVTVPAWNGHGPYPTVKLRMDFRDPRTAGTFVYHCHILHHAEAGMMGKIQVNP